MRRSQIFLYCSVIFGDLVKIMLVKVIQITFYMNEISVLTINHILLTYNYDRIFLKK